MKTIFRKTILVALITVLATLGVAAMPFVSAYAAGENDPTPPPQSVAPIRTERLERIWARQLRIYKRMGRTDELIAKVQILIDRAKENGKDVSSVQAALDAFQAAAKDAQPINESIKGIVDSHQGFDSNGTVTDPEKARETVQAMHDKFKEIRDAMNGTGKALRQAIRDFRQANPRPNTIPTATSG